MSELLPLILSLGIAVILGWIVIHEVRGIVTEGMDAIREYDRALADNTEAVKLLTKSMLNLASEKHNIEAQTHLLEVINKIEKKAEE